MILPNELEELVCSVLAHGQWMQVKEVVKKVKALNDQIPTSGVVYKCIDSMEGRGILEVDFDTKPGFVRLNRECSGLGHGDLVPELN